jgi:hypothetical protein
MRRPNTRTACILLVVGGLMMDCTFGHFSFDRKEQIVKTATYAFLAYMVAVPFTLWFLKGERVWRWSVFALWLLQVALIVCVGLTMD